MVIPAAFLDSIVPHCCAAFGTQVARVLTLPLLWVAYEREAPVSGAQRTLIPIRLAEEIQLNEFMRVVSLMSTQSKKLGWLWCRIVNRCALSPFALIATTMMGMKGRLGWRSQGGGWNQQEVLRSKVPQAHLSTMGE